MPPRTRRRVMVIASEPQAAGAARTCLETAAAAVSSQLGAAVSLAPQRDRATGWKAAAVHPLQPLETGYRLRVRDAALGIRNPLRHGEVASDAMGRFFFPDAGPPRLLGVPAGADYEGVRFPILDDRLNDARSRLNAVARDVAQAIQGQPADAAAILRRLRSVQAEALRILNGFFTIPGSDQWDVPLLGEVRQRLLALEPELAAATSWEVVEAACLHLGRTLDGLEQALHGAASVWADYAAEPSCRFRFLVRYRMGGGPGSGQGGGPGIAPAALALASRELTRLLTGGQPWLDQWIRDKLAALALRLEEVDPSGKTLFVLKGRRALGCLEGAAKGGGSAWKAQILIDPALPADAWYDRFQRVHNALLPALLSWRTELYVLLNRHADGDRRRSDEPAGTAPLNAPDDDMPGDMPGEDTGGGEAGDDGPGAELPANLVVIDLPRHGTLEAGVQWDRLRGDVRRDAGGFLSYPGYSSVIDERVRAIRAAFAAGSGAQVRTPGRIVRLYDLLAQPGPGVTDAIAAERALIPPPLLPRSIAAAEGQGDAAVRRFLTVMLRQFAQAYGLAADPGLAAGFDACFADNLPKMAGLAILPPGLSDAIIAWGEEHRWRDDDMALTDAIGFCLWIAMILDMHLEDRAAFLRQRRAALDPLLSLLASLPATHPELGIGTAVAGSFAARLYTGALSSPAGPDPDPADAIAVRLCPDGPGFQPAVVLATVAALVSNWIAGQPEGTFTSFVDPAEGVVRLFWKAAVDIPPFSYGPLAVEIAVAPAAEPRPLLSWIQGLPVLGLEDLIRAYQRRAAAVREFDTQNRLAGTAEALTGLWLRAGNPEPPDATVEALAGGGCRYLMISAPDRASGPRADYPKSYYPAGVHRIALTENPSEIRRRLTLPPAPPKVDRTLDLLVVNQGRGGHGVLTPGCWTAEALSDAVVGPLWNAGVRARIVVLDVRLSASLLETFQPLCTDDGKIVSTLYGTGDVIVTRDVWTAIQPALLRGDPGAVWRVLEARLREVSAGITGRAHLDRFVAATDAEIHAFLADNPGARTVLSVLRCLRPVGDTLRDPEVPVDRIDAALRVFRNTPLPWDDLADAERAILDAFPSNANDVTIAALTGLRQKVRQRVEAILTGPDYRIGLDPATLSDLPLFAEGLPSLWGLIESRWPNLLALAPGLARCPTMVSVFDGRTGELDLDAGLQDMGDGVLDLLRRVEPSAPDDVSYIVHELWCESNIAQFNWVDRYLL